MGINLSRSQQCPQSVEPVGYNVHLDFTAGIRIYALDDAVALFHVRQCLVGYLFKMDGIRGNPELVVAGSDTAKTDSNP